MFMIRLRSEAIGSDRGSSLRFSYGALDPDYEATPTQLFAMTVNLLVTQ